MEVVFSEKAFREEVAREMAKIDAQHAGNLASIAAEMKGARRPAAAWSVVEQTLRNMPNKLAPSVNYAIFFKDARGNTPTAYLGRTKGGKQIVEHSPASTFLTYTMSHAHS